VEGKTMFVQCRLNLSFRLSQHAPCLPRQGGKLSLGLACPLQLGQLVAEQFGLPSVATDIAHDLFSAAAKPQLIKRRLAASSLAGNETLPGQQLQIFRV
jgi:hypothetical protein